VPPAIRIYKSSYDDQPLMTSSKKIEN
jgi:hypothetical protein